MITYDKTTKDIIVSGFEAGIAASPYDGISDCRNINLISVPKEASVNFSTSKISPTNDTGPMTNSSAGSDTVTLPNSYLDNYSAIQFSALSDVSKGIALNTTYWVLGSGGVFNLYSNYDMTAPNLINITADGLTGTWATVNMGQPKYFNHFVTPYVDCYFMVDTNGRVWSNFNVLPNLGSLWTFTGNSITGTKGSAHGNGLVNYIPSDVGTTGIGYLFVFRDFQIDYATITSNTTLAWTYGWKPADASTGNNNYLRCATTASNYIPIHEALIAPDNKVYYCDSNWIGRWYQKDPAVGFLPGTLATYVFDETKVLPSTDVAQCLAPLGNNLLIGGKNNVIYPWDTFSQLAQYPILIAEYNAVKMVTVNTNTFIFTGNRGRIYVTNGSQVSLYKKIPDHLSGTVEPYFTWGGATSQKNQLYFSASVTTNAGVANNNYGGLWAIDLDTKAIRLTNKLSYGTYAGLATALIPNFSTNPAGTGLYIGWDSGASTYGIDTTVSAPYTGGQAYIDSDLIPIGTFLKPNTNGRVEFKLARPLVSGETVSMWYRQIFGNDTTSPFTQIGSTTTYTTNGSGTTYSDVFQNVPFQNSQWVQLRVVLTSTASSPSFCRLTECRIGN